MNETQRATALRLADELERGYDARTMKAMSHAAAILRELLAEPEPAPGYCKHCKQYTIEQPLPAEPDEDAQYRCGGPGCDGNCCQPVQEPVIWIQSNHLQHAKNGPYLARTGPTKLMSDFLPLYAHPPQQPMHCPKDGGECGAGGYCRPEPQQRKPLSDEQVRQIVVDASTSWAFKRDGSTSMRIARAIERAHGIGEPT